MSKPKVASTDQPKPEVKKVEVRVVPLGAKIVTLNVAENATVADILKAAKIDATKWSSFQVNGQTVKLDTVVGANADLMLTPKNKGG